MALIFLVFWKAARFPGFSDFADNRIKALSRKKEKKLFWRRNFYLLSVPPPTERNNSEIFVIWFVFFGEIVSAKGELSGAAELKLLKNLLLVRMTHHLFVESDVLLQVPSGWDLKLLKWFVRQLRDCYYDFKSNGLSSTDLIRTYDLFEVEVKSVCLKSSYDRLTLDLST